MVCLDNHNRVLEYPVGYKCGGMTFVRVLTEDHFTVGGLPWFEICHLIEGFSVYFPVVVPLTKHFSLMSSKSIRMTRHGSRTIGVWVVPRRKVAATRFAFMNPCYGILVVGLQRPGLWVDTALLISRRLNLDRTTSPLLLCFVMTSPVECSFFFVKMKISTKNTNPHCHVIYG